LKPRSSPDLWIGPLAAVVWPTPASSSIRISDGIAAAFGGAWLGRAPTYVGRDPLLSAALIGSPGFRMAGGSIS